MRRLDYRIVNVFAARGQRLSGNALAVFENGEGLSDEEMAALALQLNLAEITFLLPSERANAKVRIFTPTTEMPFAGHPSLGSAFVVRALAREKGGESGGNRGGDELVLEVKAGDVPVKATGDRFQLTAPNAPARREVAATPAEIDTILGLAAGSTLPGGAWIATGVEQFVVPLADVEAVRAARPAPAALARVGAGTRGEACMYVFAEDPTRTDEGRPVIVARFFYLAFGAVVEDPATGSACANLGGWMQLAGRAPCAWAVEQGDLVKRPSRLRLDVEASGGAIRVAGDVVEIGRGFVEI
jgi:trans-2,3-dihydro-3-hydroxyanthranilate isomerase